MTIDKTPRLILGSSSPRRLELLHQIGIVPDHVAAADIDETPHKNELPSPYCKRMAIEKNEKLAPQFSHDFLITADSTGVLGRRILGKPEDDKDEEKFLRLLSGRSHKIITCVTVRAPDGKAATRTNITRLKIKRLSDADIAAYVATREWEGKACGYKIGGSFDQFIASINGSPSGIAGLPLYETVQMLKGLGYAHCR